MAIIPIPFSPLSTTPPRAFFKPLHLPTLPAIRISNDPWRRRRGLTVVTRAGLSANSYVLAFLLPLSLLAATIFTSIRIADKLDQDYLEENICSSIDLGEIAVVAELCIKAGAKFIKGFLKFHG
ncbi:hypothetical protein SADUNF_Sadunf01G0019700 [Salix dunnii]|uniref:Uncharacterized protein n=1 Tax=Salix dunnii TaxID=1413687 RepID=A0A835TKU8_9ROSI|nr:hypothetical protein SADUNF_Sadunf01G0019700 [Salix dunnii]